MQLILALFFWLLFWLVPLGGILLLGYGIVSLPLRRRERARTLLTLIDVGLKDGRRVEDTIAALANARDPGLGPKFLTLATFMRSGLPLTAALEAVPRILPTAVIAMLKAGERLGDLRKVLPGCRQYLKDRLAATRGMMNYMLVAAFLTTPAAIAILTMMQFTILPKLHDVVTSMDVQDPLGLKLLLALRGPLVILEFLLLLIVWLTAFVYIGGPMMLDFGDAEFAFISHRIFHAIPWRRKRMQRDFSQMLAILLDGGVPEPEALNLAAECTGNEVFRRKAAQAVAGLKRGLKLPEAVQLMDDSGEFRWRLTHAIQNRGGFLQAISGWCESLDARASQMEQASAQAITTGLVLLNGIFVGAIVISAFSLVIAVINQGLLW